MSNTRRGLIEKLAFESTESCVKWPLNRTPSHYGKVTYRGKTRSAHRVSAFLNGIISDLDSDELVLHTCDVRTCINPKHLYTGTHSDNMWDKVNKGRDTNKEKLTCKYGHPKTPENRYKTASYNYCKVCRRIRDAQR